MAKRHSAIRKASGSTRHDAVQAKKEEKARVAAGETTQSITPSGGNSGGSGSGDAGDVTP